MAMSWKGYITEFDGLRAVAIMGVLATHFVPQAGEMSWWSSTAAVGWIGVDLFFVISGMLIVGILLDTRDQEGCLARFYGRRTLRIAPVYYVYLGVVFVLLGQLSIGRANAGLFLEEAGSPWWYCLYFTNVKLAIEAGGIPHALRILWSLAIEEQFYLVVPFLVIFLPRKYLTCVFFAIIAVAIVTRCITYYMWPANHQLQYALTLCRMDSLAIGGLIAIGVRKEQMVAPAAFLRGVAAVIAVSFLSALAMGMLDRRTLFCRSIGYTLVALFFAVVVVFVVQHRDTSRTSLLRGRALCYIGKISYGIYVWHLIAGAFAVKLLVAWGVNSTEHPLLVPAVQATAAVFVASLSWYLLEQPFLRLKRYVG